MKNRFETPTMPATREPRTLLAVDRAVSEFRRGRMVVLQGSGGEQVLALAAEAVTDDVLSALNTMAGEQALLAITARRAQVMGLRDADASKVAVLKGEKAFDALAIQAIADPLTVPGNDPSSLAADDASPFSCFTAAVGLAKIARLLPAAVVARISNPDANDLAAWAARHDLFLADAGDVFQYDSTAARTLRAVSEAKVPLMDAEKTKIIAFRPDDGGLEHLAILIGEPDSTQPVLTRLHSECFTGDLLGSLRCDCGDQLRGAIQEIARDGGGVLLYLAQEGRGIGLVNKLRAYELQDRGFDTLDANEQLGFDADERVYLPAARMLKELGFDRVRLLTNNPDKVDSLARLGVEVTERVAHAFPSNRHNELYLETKAQKSGHLF